MSDKILIFITADHLPTTALSCYGNRNTQSPCLDELILQGAVFDEHYAPANFPDASLNAWATGQATPLPNNTPLKKKSSLHFIETLSSQNVITSQLSFPAPNSEHDVSNSIKTLEEKVHQFFKTIEGKSGSESDQSEEDRSSVNAFFWIQISSPAESSSENDSVKQNDEKIIAWLEEVILQLQKQATAVLSKKTQTSFAWLITSQENQFQQNNSDVEHSAFYACQLSQSLSQKLKRPLVLSGNFLPENCPQRIYTLTTAQDIHATIIDYLNTEKQPRLNSPASFQSLLSVIFESDLEVEAEKKTPSQSRQLLLLDEHQAGLRTETDLTVLPLTHLQTNQNETSDARYYLKPEDQYDVNNAITNDPELAQKRVTRLKEVFSQKNSE